MNILYGIGAAAVLVLGCIALFGSGEAVFPDAMLPFSQRGLGIIWLAIGGIPMLVVCGLACRVNKLRETTHRKRNILLVFLPGIIAGGFFLFICVFIAALFLTWMTKQ